MVAYESFDCTLINYLSGILAKSGPLDVATKNSFPLFFVCEKGLVHMYYIFVLLQAKYQFCPSTGFPAVIERLKFMDFERRATAN